MRIDWIIRIVVCLTAYIHKNNFLYLRIDKAGNFEYFRKTATSKILLKTCLN